MRPRMRVLFLRVPGEMIAALDNERRLYPRIPARNAIVRELLDEALGFRRAARPKSSGSGRGEPFPIDTSDWPDVLRAAAFSSQRFALTRHTCRLA